jgi:hypothetical protein
MTALVFILALVIIVLLFLTLICFKYEFNSSGVLFACLLTAVVVVSLVAVPWYAFESYTCGEVAKKQGLEYDYGFFTHCMVREPGETRWYPMNQQRINK